MARVIVVNGTIGAGKSSTAAALRHHLAAVGHLTADIDLDALCQLSPGRDADPFNSRLGFDNLAAVWPNYEALGTDYLVVARVVEDPEDRQRYERALPGCDVRVVRVVASPAVRAARVAAREIEQRSRDWHLARSDGLAARLAELDLDDLVVDNDDRDIANVAAEILQRLKWTSDR
ncbi:MAG: AAA family ATPase [Geodermatophilaceae bacterium]|nr:AAA family ATPase [Geodermatophilaceae bacterium]